MRTPTRTPTKTGNKTPKKNSQVTTDNNCVSVKGAENGFSSFSSLVSKRNARLLSLPRNGFTSFSGLKNFPNVRVIDLQDNPVEFSIESVLVAFRSLNITAINGVAVTDEDYEKSFSYSAVVTCALRKGMDPNLAEDPEEALKNAMEFFGQKENAYTYEDETIQLADTAEIYSWYMLDEEFNWKPIPGEESALITPLNYPMKCELRNVHIDGERTSQSATVIIPERDGKYHVFAEISGNAVEGGILAVRAPLSSKIEWKHADDDELLKEGTLILPLTADSVGKRIACDITPRSGVPATRLVTPEVKPGEFRFKSLKLQGQLVENDEITFEISTKGTKASFKGIRILRSARHGEWENVDFLSAEQTDGESNLKYTLTVQDIGCVIRAVCITEGGGPPLMLTSSERVQPSAPRFITANIHGSMCVGMPIFAVAQYQGGVQGNCKYEWSIGGSKQRPVIVPKESDIGKTVSCVMTPIRSDGSIGKKVVVTASSKIQTSKTPMQEKFLVFHKKTKSGKLQMSFADKPESDKLFVIHEGETIIISKPCDWAVVDSHNNNTGLGVSKTFTAGPEHVKGILVVFGSDFFAIVGQIEAAQPTATNVEVTCDKSSAFITAKYDYYGGVEGRSIIQWNKSDGGKAETVVAFGRSHHLSLADRGCIYRAIVTPVSLDGLRGTPTTSEPFFVEDDCVTFDEKPTISLIPPEAVVEDKMCVIKVVPQGQELEPSDESIIQLTSPLTKRNAICWVYKGRVVRNDMSYKPTKSDIGKVFTIQVRDKLRGTVICECQLPAVEGASPSVSDVRLTVGEITADNKRRVNVHSKYYGGVEGDSIIIWRAQPPGSDEIIELARTKQTWVDIDDSFGGAKIGVIYVPKSTTQEEPGEPVESEMVLIPEGPEEEVISVVSAKIVANEDLTELKCIVKTSGPGHVEYNWGYDVNGDKQFTDEVNSTRAVTEDDFDFPVFCHIQPITPDGTNLQEVIVYMDPQLSELMIPTILDAKIQSVDAQKKAEFVQGQELSVSIDYRGPPIANKIVRWQREVNGDWKNIIDSETYTPSLNDTEKNIRAIVAVQASHSLIQEMVCSEEFIAPSVLITKDAVISKIAGTLHRRGKAQFDVILPTEEKGTANLEGATFTIKKGARELHKAPLKSINLEIMDNERSLIEIKSIKGYNTQLIFLEKKLNSGDVYNAEQARDLFVETLRKFRGMK